MICRLREQPTENSQTVVADKIGDECDITKGDWSSGMIPVLGTGGPGFNSRIAPFLKRSLQVPLPSTKPFNSSNQRKYNKTVIKIYFKFDIIKIMNL